MSVTDDRRGMAADQLSDMIKGKRAFGLRIDA